MTRLLCALLLITLPAVPQAAEPASAQPASDAGAASTTQDGGPTKRADTAPQGADAAQEAATTRKAGERFTPSEKISEDLSVSFPSDI